MIAIAASIIIPDTASAVPAIHNKNPEGLSQSPGFLFA